MTNWLKSLTCKNTHIRKKASFGELFIEFIMQDVYVNDAQKNEMKMLMWTKSQSQRRLSFQASEAFSTVTFMKITKFCLWVIRPFWGSMCTGRRGPDPYNFQKPTNINPNFSWSIFLKLNIFQLKIRKINLLTVKMTHEFLELMEPQFFL